MPGLDGGPTDVFGRTHVKAAGPGSAVLPPAEEMMAALEGLTASRECSCHSGGTQLHDLIALTKQNPGLEISLSYNRCESSSQASSGPPDVGPPAMGPPTSLPPVNWLPTTDPPPAEPTESEPQESTSFGRTHVK